MAQTVAELMTRDPVTIEKEQSVTAAAKLMAKRDIGDVIVLNNGKVTGILTDRDIVVRAVAAEKALDTKVADIASDADLVSVTPETPVDQAVTLMRKHSVRRLPVLRKGQAVGVISIGDLAIERDSSSVLADISAAEGNG